MMASAGEVLTSVTEQRLETIVAGLADAVTIRDLEGRVIYANDAALRSMGFASLAELRALSPEALMSDYIVTGEGGEELGVDDIPSVRLLRGESPEPLTIRYVERTSGRERWSVLKTTPLHDSTGRLEAAVTIIEDVTATKRAELRGRFLARAGEILASSLDYEQTLRNVAWLAVPEIADWCAVDLVDERGVRQQVVAAHPDPEKLELARRLRRYEPERPDPDQGIGAVVRTGESQLYPDIPDELLAQAAIDDEHLRLLRAIGMRSVLIVPMPGAMRTIGTMTLVNAESGRRFTDDDREFAEQLASRAAVAVENARLYTQRSQIATTLQRSLLPKALAQFEGWELAAIYRPAEGEYVEVGGDFYDAFETARGRFVVIGDVTGKGVDAAAMTALVRHGARFLAEDLSEPAAILARLDATLLRQPELSICSALCVHLGDGELVFSSAGHPLPLHVSSRGTVPVGDTGPVLGAFEGGRWPTHSLALAPDDALLLYTDGVTDTVGEHDRFGEGRLRDAVDRCGPQPAALLLDCIERRLIEFRAGPWADDIAAVALRRRADRLERDSGG